MENNKDDKEEEKKEKKPIVIPDDHTFSFYIKPANFVKVISNIKLVFASWSLLGYIGQFLLIIAVINIYSDRDRLTLCTSNTLTGTDASKVYDTALLMLAVYHLIEWFRFTIFMVACFLGVNLITLYYILYANTLFGIAAYIAAHV